MGDGERRKRSARFVDIAEAAGVGIATVNRVLNEHGSVAPQTRARVVEAAKRLGVPRLLPDLRHGLTRFDVILPRSPTPFFRRLELAFEQSLQMLDRRIVVHRHQLPEDDDELIARTILRPPPRRHGLATALHESPRVRDALAQAQAQGQAVVTLVSDIAGLPGRRYVGIDNLQAGRTAGHFLARFIGRGAVAGPGRVLVLTNVLGYRAHVDRTAGCRQALAERGPGLQVEAPVACHDDADRTYDAVRRALAAPGPVVVGLYNSGAGSAGIAAALERAGRSGDVAWVGHELSDEHRALLVCGAMDLVIDQDPDGQAMAALQHLLHAAGWLDRAPETSPHEFRLYAAENLTASPYLPAG